jgi:D-arabinonate dehydratase
LTKAGKDVCFLVYIDFTIDIFEVQMKIEHIETSAYVGKHKQPYSNGKYTYATTDIVICRVYTYDEYEGIGWAHGTGVVIAAMESMKERLIGEDPFNTERIWNLLYLPRSMEGKGLRRGR